ncbi:MAG: efflux RND transporter periplasmic adaptor subunit, partial [Alphaproteobacteria bacterium]|nr:efflux RND transporter periplasmic adaptor subunit [Alphaproteobacteria bacterium]
MAYQGMTSMWNWLYRHIQPRQRRWLAAGVVAAAAVAVAGFYLNGRDSGAQSAFRLARVERGPIAAAVSASGSLNAVVTVQVGSQLSGLIKDVYADFNSEVKKDQVIAIIDPQTFQAKVNQAAAELDVARAQVLTQISSVERWRADVRNARANVAAGKAQVAKSQAARDESERDFSRKSGLVQRGFVSSADIDKSKAAFDTAAAQLAASQAEERARDAAVGATEAQLRMAEAQVVNAEATVKQREAALQQAQIDLERTVIRAPLDGVIVLRNIDVGQTVAASLQAPTLFTIAQDLRVMEVHTTVDQADIGRVRVGQSASFTVDSYPGRSFAGEVAQIRIAPQTLQNVVTYVVVISAPNPDMRLLPGMTANVRIETAQRADVLKVPNAA